MTLDKSLNFSESQDSCLDRKIRAVSTTKGCFEDYRPSQMYLDQSLAQIHAEKNASCMIITKDF